MVLNNKLKKILENQIIDKVQIGFSKNMLEHHTIRLFWKD